MIGMGVIFTQAPGSMEACLPESILTQTLFLGFFYTVKSQHTVHKGHGIFLLDKELDMLITGKTLENIKTVCKNVWLNWWRELHEA